MRASDLRRRLVMRCVHDTPDGAGGFTRQAAQAGSVFAHVDARRRRQTVDDGRGVATVTHRVTVRWRDDIDTGVRFVDGAATYRVLATEPYDQTRRFLVCLCEEEQA